MNDYTPKHLLTERKIPFETKELNDRIVVEGNGEFIDYWMKTGKWITRKSKKKGFGCRALVLFLGISI